jgi:hypothetical protein
VLSFLPVWVSLRWSKDHDANELANKLRFHNASFMNQKESRHAKWKVEVQTCCKYHLLNPANTMQHERVSLPYGKYHTNSGVCFSAFLALIVSHIFILLGFAKLYGLLGFTNRNHNSNSNNNRNNSKQLLLQQQLQLITTSKTTAAATTTAATRITKQIKTNKNPQLHNRQQPTTNNNL